MQGRELKQVTALYYKALESADKHESYFKLLWVTIREVFRTIMEK